MVKIFALIGESGAGKDRLAKLLVRKHPAVFHEIVSCTTRPKRENEKDGIDYYFLSENQFMEYITDSKMLEYTNFKNWYYGTLLNSLSKTKINIGVFNPAGIRNLLKNTNIEVTVYQLKVEPKQRLIRQLTRESNPDVDEIIRRYGTDKEDFTNLDFERIELPNETLDDLKLAEETILAKGLAEWDEKS